MNRDIAACILKGCKLAEHCIKAEAINKRYAWKPMEGRGGTNRADSLTCHASMHPKLQHGSRIETWDEDGYKERWWVALTDWWRPRHLLYKNTRSQHGDDAYWHVNADGTNYRTVATKSKWR